MGLEPMTLRLKVWCSTDWANRAIVVYLSEKLCLSNKNFTAVTNWYQMNWCLPATSKYDFAEFVVKRRLFFCFSARFCRVNIHTILSKPFEILSPVNRGSWDWSSCETLETSGTYSRSFHCNAIRHTQGDCQIMWQCWKAKSKRQTRQ